MSVCPVCIKKECEIKESPNGKDETNYSCMNCGKFQLSRTIIASLESKLDDEIKRAVLSHAIRKMQRNDEPCMISSDMLKRILENCKLPDHRELINNLILYLGDNSTFFGDTLTIHSDTHQAIIGTPNYMATRDVINTISNLNIVREKTNITSVSNAKFKTSITLSYDGWEKYGEIQKGKVDSKYVFMAMPFKNPEIDKIYKNIYKPAVADTGFTLRRTDEKPEAGSIDNRIKVDIRKSRFLIAEITGSNAGAYWEAGFAEGLGKPVIYTCKEKDKTHFDIRNCQTVFWDVRDMNQASEDLKAVIRATLPDEAKLNDD